MRRLGRLVIVLAVIEGGWLAFDGSRAPVVGDYVTPASGEYAGRAVILGAVLSLWYLPFGTALSLVLICLLVVPVLRRGSYDYSQAGKGRAAESPTGRRSA